MRFSWIVRFRTQHPGEDDSGRVWCFTCPIVVWLLVGICCVGCSGDDDYRPGPFRLVRSTPFHGQTQVTAWEPILLFFSQDVSRPTFDSASVTLTDLSSSQPVPIQMSFFDWWPDYPGLRVVEVTALLVESTDYQLDVVDTVEDTSGQHLESAIQVSFRTANVQRLFSPNPQGCAQWGGGVSCGDIDGDGYDDAAVKQGGLVVAFFGPDLTRQASATGNFKTGRTHEIAGGDIDGDGYIDLAVSTSNWPAGEDYVTILFGPDLSRSLDVTDPVPLGEIFGQAVVVGDVDGDGLADLVSLRGELGTTPYLSIVILYGPDLLQSSVITAPTDAGPVFTFGSGLAVGDLNDDGMEEVLVGDNLGGVAAAGRVFAFWAPSLTSYALLEDPTYGATDVGSVIAVGDITGDGINDLVVPARRSPDEEEILSWEGPDLGRLSYIKGLGDPRGMLGQVAVTDANGDGAMDVVVATPRQFSVQLPLAPAFDRVLLVRDPDGSGAFHWFGWDLSTGDVNGDGFSDLLIGEPDRASSPNCGEGRAFVFFGP